jgi:NAD(P)-dependent dehydrogenase (short-subunit alcohol dehydrogenase family)
MRKQQSGRIINIGSLAGVIGFKHCGAYSAAKFAVEGLSQAVAQEVEPFGIRITTVAPGFFRTDLLDAGNAKYARSSIADYAVEGTAEAMWSGYDGKQQGDPAKLGDVLVTIAGMADPPKQFLAGSDALAAFKPVIDARLEDLRSYDGLSKSTEVLSEIRAQRVERRSRPELSLAAVKPRPRAVELGYGALGAIVMFG